MKRRQFSAQLAVASLGLPFLNTAQAQGAPTEGTEYTKISPPVAVTAPAGKVEVVELFSYACPHCAELEPILEAWVKRLPPEVHFHRIPVQFLANPENFQPLYYALEEMNLVDAMQLKIFKAVHQERQRLNTQQDIAAFMTKNGVDATKFMAVFNSFSVRSKASRASQLVNAYAPEGVPALAVQGRFLTSPVQARGNEQALRVVSQLVQKMRGK